MNKKFKNMVVIVITLSVAIIIPKQLIKAISDQEFASNESYYANLCNSYVSSGKNRQTCEDYQAYLIRKRDKATNSAASMQKEIDSIGNDIEQISKKSKELNTQIEETNANIAAVESTIDKIQVGIDEAQVKIEQKEENIGSRKEVVKERMMQLQVKVNTNQYVDYIMGAADLVELIQRASSIESFTNYDNKLIDTLKKEMKELQAEKVEQERLVEQAQLQKENLELMKKDVEVLYQYNVQLAATFQKNQADLIAQKNESIRQANIASGNLDQIVFEDSSTDNGDTGSGDGNTGDGGNQGNGGGSQGGGGSTMPPPSSGGMIRPVNGPSTAGTWYYPASFGGGLHLGLDKGVGIGTAVYAPANGVVLKSNTATSSSGGGFIGNMIGFPYGGGNTLHILVNDGGQTYAVTFMHLSPNIMSTNQTFSKGQVIAKTGHTGNSSGAHCHIEVMKVNLSYAEAIAYWNRTNDWAWGTGWNVGGACSSVACRIQPESLGW